MDTLDEIRLFLAVADASSFAAGARAASVSPAHVSKVVAHLEARLGARLLQRTTRSVALTDVGRAYAEQARGLLDAFTSLETSVRDASAGPSGVLRLSVPVVFGAVQLEPILMAFAAAYPAVGLEVSYSDRTVNLVDEGFDLALRIGVLPDSTLVARPLGSARLATLASPAYLARHGTPATPDDLGGHEAIIDLAYREPFLWPFMVDGVRVERKVSGRLRFGRADACAVAARMGFGLTRVPSFAAAGDIAAGRLVRVLRDYEMPPLPIHLVYPHPRHLAAKVRVFVDFLAAHARAGDDWNAG